MKYRSKGTSQKITTPAGRARLLDLFGELPSHIPNFRTESIFPKFHVDVPVPKHKFGTSERRAKTKYLNESNAASRKEGLNNG